MADGSLTPAQTAARPYLKVPTFGPDPAKAFEAAMAKETAARVASGHAFPKGSASPVEYEAPAFRRHLLEG